MVVALFGREIHKKIIISNRSRMWKEWEKKGEQNDMLQRIAVTGWMKQSNHRVTCYTFQTVYIDMTKLTSFYTLFFIFFWPPWAFKKKYKFHVILYKVKIKDQYQEIT